MIAYFDIFSGISGDMVLGAFVDLGVPVKWLNEQLEQLSLPGVHIRSQRVEKNHLSSVSVFVEESRDARPRDYKTIKSIISSSPLPHTVKEQSLKAFEKIARAEASIHSRELDTVHFHEVGGVDAIVDIVGAFLCANYLGIDEVHASRVTLGSGFVECSHGTLPVPAPATLAILKDVPVTSGPGTGELVTPTGAAVLTTFAVSYGKMPDMRITGTGYGAGKRKTGSKIPNMLRIVTGDRLSSWGMEDPAIVQESVYVVETAVDDMSPEVIGYLMEKLFDAGALDVCHIPVQMKKNRPGTKIEIICTGEKLEALVQLLFRQSSTTGVRYYSSFRAALARKIIKVNSAFGEVRVKEITCPDGTIRLQPEYEECRDIADKKNIPLMEVYAQLELDIEKTGL